MRGRLPLTESGTAWFFWCVGTTNVCEQAHTIPSAVLLRRSAFARAMAVLPDTIVAAEVGATWGNMQ